MVFRGGERENFEDGKMTEKDGEIFQERKEETKKTRIWLGKKRPPEVSCKTRMQKLRRRKYI